MYFSYGKTYFLTVKRTLSQQNLLSDGKTNFLTAELTFSRQNLLSHGKTYFLTAKLAFSRQNLLSHGKTYFLAVKPILLRRNLQSVWRRKCPCPAEVKPGFVHLRCLVGQQNLVSLLLPEFFMAEKFPKPKNMLSTYPRLRKGKDCLFWILDKVMHGILFLG